MYKVSARGKGFHSDLVKVFREVDRLGFSTRYNKMAKKYNDIPNLYNKNTDFESHFLYNNLAILFIVAGSPNIDNIFSTNNYSEINQILLMGKNNQTKTSNLNTISNATNSSISSKNMIREIKKKIGKNTSSIKRYTK